MDSTSLKLFKNSENIFVSNNFIRLDIINVNRNVNLRCCVKSKNKWVPVLTTENNFISRIKVNKKILPLNYKMVNIFEEKKKITISLRGANSTEPEIEIETTIIFPADEKYIYFENRLKVNPPQPPYLKREMGSYCG